MASHVQTGTDLGATSQSEMSEASTNVHAQKRKFAVADGTVDWSQQDRVRLNYLKQLYFFTNIDFKAMGYTSQPRARRLHTRSG